jgi:predicted RNA-binding protein YlxR (DUF448 family)
LRTRSDTAGSERTCIVTGTKDVPEAMLRFAIGPDGSVVPDIRRKLPGRGVWTRLSFETVSRAAAKRAFSRAFRAKAEAPASLAETVGALLEQDALQSLSIANKAGLVVAGAFKVDSAIEAGGVAALIQASDGAADGAAKRVQALRAKLGSGCYCARRSLQVGPIGFGIGAGKCDTCCSQTWGGEFGLSRKGGSFAPLLRRRSGRGEQDGTRRRDGRQCRNV